MMKKHREINAYLPSKKFVCFDRILISGVAYVGDNYKIDRKNSNINIIEYVIEGAGKIKTQDGRVHDVCKGDLYCLPKGTNHLYYSCPGQQWAKIYVNFDGEMWNDLLSRFGIANQYIYKGLDVFPELKQIFELVKEKNERTETDCASLIFKIICKMYSHSESTNELETEALTLKKYIDCHFCEKLKIDHLAALIRKSKSQVNRIFAKEYGQTPHKYISDKRINEATVLLRDTLLSIKEISYKVGYPDEFYFSNAFKKTTGISPKQYRILKNATLLSEAKNTPR